MMAHNKKIKTILDNCIKVDYLWRSKYYTYNELKSFLWNNVISIRSNINSFFYTICPTAVRKISKLCPEINYNSIYHREIISNDKDISNENILILTKPNKKFYCDESTLADIGKYIMASLSDTGVKYVFYGVTDKQYHAKYNKNRKLVNKEYSDWFNVGLGDNRIFKAAKLYDKEKQVFINEGFEFLNDICLSVETGEESQYDNNTNDYESLGRDCKGWLFKMPTRIDKKKAEEIFSEIKNKRFKELHI